MWWKMAKKPETKSEPTYVPPPKVLTEAEEAAKIARIRALTEEARNNVFRLKAIKAEIEREGGSIVIGADENIRYVHSYGSPEAPRTYFAESYYTAKN